MPKLVTNTTALYNNFDAHTSSCEKCRKRWEKASKLKPNYTEELTEEKLIQLINTRKKVLIEIGTFMLEMRRTPKKLNNRFKTIQEQISRYKKCVSSEEALNRITAAIDGILTHMK